MNDTCLAFGMPGGWEWIIIVLIALLLFGRRLPEVARSVGKSIVEFKKGVKDIETDVDDQTREKPRLDQSKHDASQGEPRADDKRESQPQTEKRTQPAEESSRTSG